MREVIVIGAAVFLLSIAIGVAFGYGVAHKKIYSELEKNGRVYVNPVKYIEKECDGGSGIGTYNQGLATGMMMGG